MSPAGVSTTVLDDGARWAALIDENLAPRELWPAHVRNESSGPLNLAQELLAGAGTAPHATAILWRDDRISYRDLRDRVLLAAGAFARLGVQPADRVVLRFHNTPEFIVAWLAVQWVGAIGVPVPPIYRRREIAHIVNHSGAAWVLASPDLIDDVQRAASAFASPVTVLSGLDATGVPPAACRTLPEWPALITYITSGTGEPRGVVHSSAEILATADTYSRSVLGLSARDVCIGSASIAWSYGLGTLLVFPLRAGASTVLVENAGPPLPAVIAEHRATVLFSVPTMYRMLLRQPDLESFDLSSLRLCISAAEPLSAGLAEEWRARTGLEILDGLGTTELAHIVISAKSGAVRPGFMGQVVDGYEARVVDERGRDVPAGVPGRLAVRGPTGARYWRDVNAQRHAVHNGWTLTGDVCTRDRDGWFAHVRRSDALIVSGGCKISPAEVERALLDHSDVAAARVFGVADPVRGMVPHATVTLASGAEANGAVERLQLYLKSEIAPYKCPRRIEVARTREGARGVRPNPGAA